MAKKAIGTNPLYTHSRKNQSTPENTVNETAKKVKPASPASTKVTAGKSDREKGSLNK